MKIGDVVLLQKGARVNFPSGISYPAAYFSAVEISSLGENTVSWLDESQNVMTASSGDVRTLPCCYILGIGKNNPMKTYEAIKGPLAGQGVEVLMIPMSRITGLQNIPDDWKEFDEEGAGDLSDFECRVYAIIADACKDIGSGEKPW
ncbi:MAG: hypothetical protein WC824_13100 [Bacteroidota bacterium]|jgi:hypothetical protein